MSTPTQDGFTLVELLLAMTIFTLMMVVATVGFIGMNRAYVKGTVRKQLSQDTQRSVDAVAQTVRTSGRALNKYKLCPGEGGAPIACPNPASSWRGAICFDGERFIWGNEGLYHQRGVECSANTSNFTSSGTRLLDTRFRVEDLGVSPVTGQDNLFVVYGVFRTKDDAAFDNLSNPDKTEIVCKGSTYQPAQFCAVEEFRFTINARGGQ